MQPAASIPTRQSRYILFLLLGSYVGWCIIVLYYSVGPMAQVRDVGPIETKCVTLMVAYVVRQKI